MSSILQCSFENEDRSTQILKTKHQSKTTQPNLEKEAPKSQKSGNVAVVHKISSHWILETIDFNGHYCFSIVWGFGWRTNCRRMLDTQEKMKPC